MSEPLTAIRPAADTPNPETRVQCGCRRVEPEVENYAASCTGFEGGRDTKSRRAMAGVRTKMPLKRLSSSVRLARSCLPSPPSDLRLNSSLNHGGPQETGILNGEWWWTDWLRDTPPPLKIRLLPIGIFRKSGISIMILTGRGGNVLGACREHTSSSRSSS